MKTGTLAIFPSLLIVFLTSHAIGSDAPFNPADIKVTRIGEPVLQAATDRFIGNQPEGIQVDYGEEIAFIYNNDLWVQKVDGTGRRVLVTKGTDYAAIGSPAWSLDGKKLAFAAILKNDPRVVDLFVSNADGGGIQAILRLNAGYYSSTITSVSWSWDNTYIMFVYGYNAADLTTIFVVCTITKTGTNFALGPRNDVTGAQYEPTIGASRYAYTTLGTPLNYNSDLLVSNMAGTTVVNWWRLTAVDCFGDVNWLTATSICAVARNIGGYPNMELLVRFDRPVSTTSNVILIQSATNGKLSSPSFGPTRRKLYMCETVNNVSTLWYSEWNSSWVSITNVARGGGSTPNWRQVVPVPDQVTLLTPINNATNVVIRPTLTWQAAPSALSYRLIVKTTVGGVVVYDQSSITATSRQIGPLATGTQYSWTVTPSNSVGTGPVSSTFKFTTSATGVPSDRTLPVGFALEQNSPNPFNPSTSARFTVPRQAVVKLTVYDMSGALIRELVGGMVSAGVHTVEWDGTLGSGRNASSGVYFLAISAVTEDGENFHAVRKMVLIR